MGMQVDPKTKSPFLTYMPCLVGEGNKRASAASTSGVVWNPNALWLAQDSPASVKNSIFLVTVDGQFGIVGSKTGPASGFNENHTLKLYLTRYNSSKGTYDNGPPSPFVCDVLQPHVYGNLSYMGYGATDANHLGSWTNAPPQIYEKAASDGTLFDISTLPKVDNLLQFQGMNNGSLENGAVWVQLRSVPYYAQASSVLGDANNVCPYENPDDVAAIPRDKPGTLFCCGSGSDALYTVLEANQPMQTITAATCQNMPFSSYVEMLKHPPERMYPGMGSLTDCPPGRYGPGCLLTCPKGWTTPNCGCLRGLTAQEDGSCRMMVPLDCVKQQEMQGVSLLTGQCACAPGLYGSRCEKKLAGPAGRFDFLHDLLHNPKTLFMGGGILCLVISFFLFLSPDSSKSKTKSGSPSLNSSRAASGVEATIAEKKTHALKEKSSGFSKEEKHK